MKRGLFIIYILLLTGFTTLSRAQNNVDVRVTENLNRLNFKYDIKDDGTFQFSVPLDMRTQMILVHSATSRYDRLEIREIYSVIYQSPQAPSASVMQRLLLDNSQKKLGGWELIFDNNTYFIVFTTKIPADLDETNLKSVIDIVATSADTMEETLFNTDEW